MVGPEFNSLPQANGERAARIARSLRIIIAFAVCFSLSFDETSKCFDLLLFDGIVLLALLRVASHCHSPSCDGSSQALITQALIN